MKILQIEAHPDFNNMERTSNKLAYEGYHQLLDLGHNQENIKLVSLYHSKHLPLRITQETLTGAESKELTALREEYINDFIEADQVYIYMPLHNFNINSGLKDYFDTILVANKTFKYTENGPVGLLDNDKKVTFVLTSGSEFTKEYSDTSMDHAPRLMSSILSMMGIEDFKVIRAEGLDIITNDKELIVNEAIEELKQHIKSQH